MEQATNLFTKGMQLDTHPMVLSNDTLTDCLNGTLITMNGNEVILQNDMGNRRVDKAFLPPGYEPVGMKEYGGIIYVAAYNPITNKSLIGSFPSPLKKLSSTSNGDLSERFDFSTFTGPNNTETDSDLNLNILKSDSFMIPLSKDLHLRAGDKFAIYSEGLSDLLDLLTNYNNISGNKAYSPKNRKYTLQLGVLNSLNEFVDITKTLCRWKDFGENNNHDWQPVKYNTEVSEIYKFNDGYFISDAFENTFNSETIEDAKLIKERQKIATNTYSYKLVGPLYLKIAMNHIDNFNYNIYGTFDNNVATLWVEGFITYNCPDGAINDDLLIDSDRNYNENYATFNEGVPSIDFGFDLISHTPADVIIDKSVYNPNNNTYTTKIVKKYTNITATSGTSFDYTIGVKADESTPGVYLKGLSVRGSIDLNMLGSGTLKFDSWRFYNNYNNDEPSTTLTFGFNAYPEYGKSFGNLRFKFTKLGTNEELLYPTQGFLPLYNGKQTILFNWSDLNLLPNTTYTVIALYNQIDNILGTFGETYTIQESSTRWFLTTNLFNDFYLSSSGISDFCNVPNDNTSESIAFYNKMIVNLSSESKLINDSELKEDIEGKLITNQQPKIDYSYKHTYNINIKTNPKLIIKDSNLYPDYVYINSNYANSVAISTVTVSKLGDISNPSADSDVVGDNPIYYNNNFRLLLTTTKGNNLTPSLNPNSPIDELNNKDLLVTKVSVSGDIISGYIKYYDVFKARGETIDVIYNGFGKFSDILNTNYVLPSSGSYCGVVVNFDSRSGRGDAHFINVVVNQSNNNTDLPSNDDMPENWFGVSLMYGDSRKVITISTLRESIFEHFNHSNISDKTFTYLFSNDNYNTIAESDTGNQHYLNKSGKYYTRVWWKMPNGEWAVFPNLYLKGTDLATFIKQSLGNKELVYYMYKEVNNDSFYAPKEDYIYYNKYSIPLIYKINYTLSGVTADQVISTGNACGNLQFSVTSNPSIISDDVTFILNSSEKFFDDIHSVNSDSISNIYLGDGLGYGAQKDSLGRPLNPSYIYSLENGELVRLKTLNFYIDDVQTINNKNRLLYGKVSKKSVSPRYLSAASGDSHTVLVYDSLNVVDPV